MTRVDAIGTIAQCHQCETFGPQICGTHHDLAHELHIVAADVVFDTGTWEACAVDCRCRWCTDGRALAQKHLPDAAADGVALLLRHRDLVRAGEPAGSLRLRQLTAEIRDRLTRPWPGVAVEGVTIEPDPVPAPLAPEQRERRRALVQRWIAKNKT
jgi:hypothetical protein